MYVAVYTRLQVPVEVWCLQRSEEGIGQRHQNLELEWQAFVRYPCGAATKLWFSEGRVRRLNL